MLRGLLCGTLVAGLSATASAQVPPKTGFVCLSPDGQQKSFNVELKKKRYDDGSGNKRVESASETTITFHSFISTDPTYGAMSSSLKMDRRTLVLTEAFFASGLNRSKTTIYQCYMRPPIDFSAGVKF